MKPEAQRIAIARACGWVGCSNGWGLTPPDSKNCRYDDKLPDYLNDLNAMHEAEKVLSEEQQSEYQIGLANIVAKSPFSTYGHWSDVGSVFSVHSIAAQRAEAFLRTVGKWTE